MVQVIEAYSEYAPPCDARAAIAGLLDSMPSDRAAGLQSVVLTNKGALRGSRKRAWSWHRGRKSRHTNSLGMYHPEWRRAGAYIELFVDQIIGGTPAWALRFGLVRTFVFGPTLYHEVGHHIHRRHRPEQREPEDVADEWKRTLMRHHFRRQHAVARIVLWPVGWVARRLRPSRRPSPKSR